MTFHGGQRLFFDDRDAVLVDRCRHDSDAGMAFKDLLMTTHPDLMVRHPLHDCDFALAFQQRHQAFRSDACLLTETVADAGFVLKLANEAEKSGMGGFVFCDLPDIDATTSAGRMVLMMMASVAEAEDLRGVVEPMVRTGLSYRAMADALAGVGKLSSTGRPLAPAQIARILQRLGLSGKPLGSDQAWDAA